MLDLVNIHLNESSLLMETELCNMCMITDAEGRVLVQERLPKPSNPWSGLTFPGGHVEPGETVVAPPSVKFRKKRD